MMKKLALLAATTVMVGSASVMAAPAQAELASPRAAAPAKAESTSPSCSSGTTPTASNGTPTNTNVSCTLTAGSYTSLDDSSYSPETDVVPEGTYVVKLSRLRYTERSEGARPRIGNANASSGSDDDNEYTYFGIYINQDVTDQFAFTATLNTGDVLSITVDPVGAQPSTAAPTLSSTKKYYTKVCEASVANGGTDVVFYYGQPEQEKSFKKRAVRAGKCVTVYTGKYDQYSFYVITQDGGYNVSNGTYSYVSSDK